jgi:hypothetical protein
MELTHTSGLHCVLCRYSATQKTSVVLVIDDGKWFEIRWMETDA